MQTLLITLASSGSTIDLQVPGEVPIGELLPTLLAICESQPREAPPEQRTQWHQQLSDVPMPLDITKTLSEEGVTNGAIVHLHYSSGIAQLSVQIPLLSEPGTPPRPDQFNEVPDGPLQKDQHSKRGISRRAVLLGLTGLALVGGASFATWELGQRYPTSIPAAHITPSVTVAKSPSVVSPSPGISKGAILYRATRPGSPCDSNGGGVWQPFNSPTIVCQSTGTEIGNPNPQSVSPKLVGTFLTSLPPSIIYPNDYVIEVQLQQIGSPQADFGIYFRNQLGFQQQGVYTFFINANETWSNYVYDNTTGAPHLVKAGTFSDASGPVVVDVVVVGSNFSFYLNGKLIGKANDGTYSIGTVGIAVDAGGTILASNFALYATQ